MKLTKPTIDDFYKVADEFEKTGRITKEMSPVLDAMLEKIFGKRKI